MINHYFKVAYRNLVRNKIYSAISILGLTVGLTSAMSIFIWVRYELSFDSYHENAQDICQPYMYDTNRDDGLNQFTVSPIVAEILESEFPEVIKTARRGWLGKFTLRYEDKIFEESNGFGADPSMLEMLSYEFLTGNPKTAFENTNSIILTESMSEKYFGEENPMGKLLMINKEFTLEVTGVIKNPPANSQFQFDFLTPILFAPKLGRSLEGEEFSNCYFLTFIQLAKNTNLSELNQKLIKRLRVELDNQNVILAIALIPITEIHIREGGGLQKIYIFSIIGIIILIIASFNFMNMSISLSSKRAKEIGIRKVSGSLRGQLMRQFFSESFIIVFISADIALILIVPLISFFNQITNSNVTVYLLDPVFLFILLGVLFLTAFVAGFYPALYLSSFNPLLALKDRFGTGRGKSRQRRILVGIQFCAAIIFLICAIIMHCQLKSIKNYNYGLNKDNILYIKLDDEASSKYEVIKQELLQHSEIEKVTTANYLPVGITNGNFDIWGVNDGIDRRILETQVGYDYLDFFELAMADGRFYDETFGTDINEAVIVNETAINKVGLENPVNNPFYYRGRNFNLIGVMKDFQHQSPVNRVINPVIFRQSEAGQDYLFVRLSSSVIDLKISAPIIARIESVFKKLNPDSPFSLSYLDEFSTERERLMETRQSIILFVSILSISIACLGLLGLSALMNEKRTKEIGIRKVLGASTSQISVLLSREFVVIALLANLIAWPIAWFAMEKWLQDFTNRIDLTIWPFLLGGLIALMIAILTVSSQAIKSAIANPVNSLRDE